MHCKEIMSHDVQWILAGETVASAAKLMAFHNLGLLPVCTPDGKPIGVITDRDIALRVIGRDRLAAQTVVEDVMSAPVQFVAPDCPLDRIGQLMNQGKVSRLLVLDDAGHIAGIVSIVDLLIHSTGKGSLEAVRGVYARESSARSFDHPHRASMMIPEYFRGIRDATPDRVSAGDNPARAEANSVVHGGTNDLKEFPS